MWLTIIPVMMATTMMMSRVRSTTLCRSRLLDNRAQLEIAV
jgi:hypothetical protein